MKVLIVNNNDIHGGAARAAYRLHQALLSLEIDSQMLVINKQSDDFTVLSYQLNIGWIKARLRNIQRRFFNPAKAYPNKSKTLFSTSYLKFSKILEKINEINPDIVHLHWVCNEMINIENLSKIKAPIIWSLHDMWAFTGGCHYDEECGRYINSCGQCKVLGSKKENDLSKKNFQCKQKTLSKTNNMTIVSLSQWLSDCAKKSTLLKDKKIVTIPNPIDTLKFKPIDKIIARELLSLPKNRKLVLYGAMGASSDPRKGFQELQKAINHIHDYTHVELVVFGSSKPEKDIKLKFTTHYLGQLHDDVALTVLYSACDVMVVPSLQENLSNVIMESLSCATPVVAFSIGGNGDMIIHKKNGYLAIPFDAVDLANGIEWVLNTNSYNYLCKKARSKVLENYDSNIIAEQYISLYKDILDEKKDFFRLEK